MIDFTVMNAFAGVPAHTEMNRLIDLLISMQGTSEEISFDVISTFGPPQVIIYDNEKLERLNDAVCHSGSLGHERGLLETWTPDGFDVVGYLTAEEAIEIFRKTIKRHEWMMEN